MFSRLFWRFINWLFPYVRDTLLYLRLIYHEQGRQRYHLGDLTPGKTLKDLKLHLADHGFDNHFIAWVDQEELLGLRKLVAPHGQYHIRVFEDFEIRGHYELTPEAHPFHHFMERGMEPRTKDFMQFLQGWAMPRPGMNPEK